MRYPIAIAVKDYIIDIHDGNVTHAAKALGVDRSTLHRVRRLNAAYVIESKLYTIKRKSK